MEALQRVAHDDKVPGLASVQRRGASDPSRFFAAVLDAELAVRKRTYQTGVIPRVVEILTRSRVQQFRAHIEAGRAAQQVSDLAAMRVEARVPRAESAIRRAWRDGPQASLNALGLLMEAVWDARKLTHWKERRERMIRREYGDRFSLDNPRQSTAFLEDIIVPLWLAVRPHERAQAGNDVLSTRKTAHYVREIVVSYFGPQIAEGLTDDAVRKRAEKHLRKKGLW